MKKIRPGLPSLLQARPPTGNGSCRRSSRTATGSRWKICWRRKSSFGHGRGFVPASTSLRSDHFCSTVVVPLQPTETFPPSLARSRRRHVRSPLRRPPSAPASAAGSAAPCSTPDRSTQLRFAVARSIEISEQRRNSHDSAAGGRIFGRMRTSRMEHPRLQITWFSLSGLRPAHVGVDRIRTVTGGTCGRTPASGHARRSASRENSSTMRNGSPTEAICTAA